MAPLQRKRRSGTALLMAVLLLALLAMVGLASLETATRDRQVAGYHSRSQTALYAAEAGVAYGLGLIRRDVGDLAGGGVPALEDYNPSDTSGGPPDFPDQANAFELGTDFPPPGPPTFFMDPNAADPNDGASAARAVRYLGAGERCRSWIMSMEQGKTQWREALFDLRVRGENPGGTRINLQAVGASCHPYDG